MVSAMLGKKLCHLEGIESRAHACNMSRHTRHAHASIMDLNPVRAGGFGSAPCWLPDFVECVQDLKSRLTSQEKT